MKARPKPIYPEPPASVIGSHSNLPPTPEQLRHNVHTKSALRRALNTWTPQDRVEAYTILEECLARASALSTIFEQYAWDESEVSVSDLRCSLEVLDDLLYVGYGIMADWWDRDKEGQA